MGAGARLGAGLLVEVVVAVFVVAAQIPGELLALLNDLFVRIELRKMSAYINLRRRELVEVPFAISRGFVTEGFGFDAFAIFDISFDTSVLVLVCADSRVMAWILHVEKLAPSVCSA